VVPGYGLKGTVFYEGKPLKVAIGLVGFIENMLGKQLSIEHQKNELISILLVDSSIYIFRLRDTLRPNLSSMLSFFRKNQLQTLMLTGDHQVNAEHVAHALGLDEIHANLRPEDKLQLVSDIAQKKGLAMVGDGINDAPALARASVGISMGKVGSATAIDASDVVLLNDDLSVLSWLFSKAHATLRIVKENLFLALIIIIFASGCSLLGFIPLWLAVILHEGGTVLVGLNSLRLLKSKTTTTINL
jgi:Cd2+/Zn2+-exporting ATPase